MKIAGIINGGPESERALSLMEHPSHVASIDPPDSVVEQAKILFTTPSCHKALPPQYLMALTIHQKDGEPATVIPWASLCQQRMAHPIINLNQVPISQREAHGLVPPVGRGKTDAKERYASAPTGRLVHLLCSLWPASPARPGAFLGSMSPLPGKWNTLCL